MRKALSIAAGASSETRRAEEAVDQQVEVDQAEADRHRQHQQQHPPHLRDGASRSPELNRNGVLRRSQAGISSWTSGADQDADRVGVDPVVAVERRLEHDEDEDDRQVPEERRDREGAEAVVAVEDADDDRR